MKRYLIFILSSAGQLCLTRHAPTSNIMEIRTNSRTKVTCLCQFWCSSQTTTRRWWRTHSFKLALISKIRSVLVRRKKILSAWQSRAHYSKWRAKAHSRSVRVHHRRYRKIQQSNSLAKSTPAKLHRPSSIKWIILQEKHCLADKKKIHHQRHHPMFPPK